VEKTHLADDKKKPAVRLGPQSSLIVDFTNDLMRDLTNRRIFIDPKRSF
jgi:hypothetical protein